MGALRGGHTAYDGSRVKDPRCHPTGPTSFALFTLAKCGVTRKDPAMKRGYAWIRKQTKNATRTERTTDGLAYDSYESASIILMLTAMYEPEEQRKPSRNPTAKPRGSPFSKVAWRLLHDCVAHLVGKDGMPGGQTSGGGWSYWLRSESSDADVSATQFALLALRSAVRAGYPLSRLQEGVWERALEYLLMAQKTDGSFPYTVGKPWSAGMTAAGLASLLICREQLALAGGAPDDLDGAIERALGHLAEHYDPRRNVGAKKKDLKYYNYCYLYAVERVGALSSRHLLGKHDWYRTGATALLEWQRSDGSWFDRSCMKPQDVLGTCFTLLFLKRATPPAVVTGK